MLNLINDGTIEENNRLTLEEGICRWDSDGDLPALRVYDGETPGGWRVTLEQAYVPTMPGSTMLKAGTLTEGYYGQTESGAMPSGEELISTLGIVGSEIQAQSVPWFKFALDDKTLYIPTQPLGKLTFTQAHAAGVVFDGKIITWDGFKYRVRYMSGTNQRQYTGEINHRKDVHKDTDRSEWDRLIYRVVSNPPPDTPTAWDSVPPYGTVGVAGYYSTGPSYIARGVGTTGNAGFLTFYNQSSALPWVPVLELIEE